MSLSVTAIEGNRQKLDGGSMFGNVPRALWQRWLPPDELGRIELACRCFLIEADGLTILCETGIGAFFEEKYAERYGIVEKDHCLIKNLAASGKSENDIDFILLSHLHFDHAGGLLNAYSQDDPGKKELLFPNATYIVGKEAWERARSPHLRDRASYLSFLPELLEKSGRLLVIDDGKPPPSLEHFLSFRFTHGHTPGQMHGVFSGDAETVLFAGDLIPGTPWVHLPVTMGYDRYPELLIDEKRSVLQEAIRGRWQILYTHDPNICSSRIKVSSEGKFIPVDQRESLEKIRL